MWIFLFTGSAGARYSLENHQLEDHISNFNLRLRNNRVVNFCENEGIRVIDPVEIFANDSRQLYLSKDVHYNDVGHQIAANEAAKYIDHLFKYKKAYIKLIEALIN